MALIDIFLLDVPDGSGTGYQTHVVRWDDVAHTINVFNADTFEQVGNGGALEYVPGPEEHVIRDSDGDLVYFTQQQYFPYAERVTPSEDPDPEHPADGTFIRTQCYGYDLYNVVADGAGGERQGALVEANSISCGYVAPPVVINGCTDPEAENYNAAATPGNPEQNLCTYAPKVFTEVKVVEVMPCTDGICLRWFNNLGGIDTWVFQGKVDRPFSSEASGEFSLASGLTVASSKSGNPAMVIRASHLNYNRYAALWQLFTSPKVWIHHPDNSTEEVYVQVANISPMPLGRRSYDLTVEIIKAPINSLRN